MASPFVDVTAIAYEPQYFCCAENNYRCAAWIAAHKTKSIVQKMLKKTDEENYQKSMVNINSDENLMICDFVDQLLPR